MKEVKLRAIYCRVDNKNKYQKLVQLWMEKLEKAILELGIEELNVDDDLDKLIIKRHKLFLVVGMTLNCIW